MSNDPKDYQATNAEVKRLADQVIRDRQAQQEETRRKVAEHNGQESVE